jgi:hypothetical protein
MPAFTATVYQNEYLPPGGTKVHAIITVDATGRAVAPRAPAGGFAGTTSATGGLEHAEVLLLDCSGSMADPPDKAAQAMCAARAAIDCLPDGVWFALVRGTGTASMVYPGLPALAAASVRSRAEAKAALDAVAVCGGTAIGRWLSRARELLSLRPDAISHATLITDGENRELQSDFEAAVETCRGLFQCDCRGVGTDWRVDELRYIATTLLGTVDAVREPGELTYHLTRLVGAATSRCAGRLCLRVWTPRGSRVRFLREVTPTFRELKGRLRSDHQGGPGVPSDHERCRGPRGSQAERAIFEGIRRSAGTGITQQSNGHVSAPGVTAGSAAPVRDGREVREPNRQVRAADVPGSLSDTGHLTGPRTVDFQTGAWGAESRDYHLHVEVPARYVGTEALAARVELVVEEQVVSTALVRAVWTDDPGKSSQVDTAVAHYASQAELVRTLQRGLEAQKAGDKVTATLLLGRGVQLARASGNEATYHLLQKVVDIDNSTTGTVRLKKNVEKIDEMVLDSRSTMTVRVNR